MDVNGKMNELPDPHQWMKKTFKLKDVSDWTFPKEVLPLEVTFEGCKQMDLISEEGAKKLRERINEFADVAEVSERGFLSCSSLFYHPFSILTMLRDEGKILFDTFSDPRNSRELALNFVKAKSFDSDFLWIGGCPTLDEEDVDVFKETIVKGFAQVAKQMSSSRKRKSSDPILKYVFTAEYDPLRGEMILFPQIEDKRNKLNKYELIMEKNALLENLEHVFKSKVIYWAEKPHLFLVKMASKKYEHHWSARKKLSNATLTNKEKTMMEWTFEYLNDQVDNLLSKNRPRCIFKPQKSQKSESTETMVDGSTRECHHGSSSDKDASVVEDPSCVDGEYCGDKYTGDREVERTMLKLAQKHDKSFEYSRTSPFLTDFDHKTIEFQLREMGFRKPKSKKRKNERTKDELVKLFNINGAPWLTPDTFIPVGKRKESVGELEFFFAPNAKEIDDKMSPPGMPSYDFINYYEESEMGNEEARKEASTFTVDCSEICDMDVGCLYQSCPCMQMSAINADGLVRHNFDAIYECCRRCPCHYRNEKCRSIVRLKSRELQSVYISPMEFTLRTLQNIQRGEVIMPFTGVRQSFVTPEDGVWSMEIKLILGTSDLEFTQYKGSEFLINTRKSGNAARFCCHSYSPNCAVIRLYRGGMKHVDPEMYLYSLGPLEAGDLMYINYGDTFGMTRKDCKCTQLLCHKPEELKLFRNTTWNEARTLLIHLEMMKRARMIQREQQFLRIQSTVIEDRKDESDSASKIVKEYSSY